ncbi:hypothetical protein FFLO_00310 [Filobasidium floriforme]|uniref:Uncharacterized protein n=1 Tax=Filobasidium floriforme TaxID=5210 RepID=A0A8K0JRU4_9TREE|nr:uncharacterized protein HD553DRAFT_313858 [Filobasidium floriforme]KAG7575491.1 hypothetical protein FFLO_00310 [Filobasidium floriforme]KAH8082629.1 hypothetical protein HD553DRAFT_313858 [Filobasidium floriforme]
MSYDNNNNNLNTGVGSTGERKAFDPSNAFSSGGLNNSTGREPFEDPRSDFAAPGAPAQAVAGNLHYGQSTSVTGGSGLQNIGSTGLGHEGHHHHTTGTNLGSTGSGLGGNHHNAGTGYDENDSRRNTGDHPLVHDTRHHGDIRSGTADDHLVGQGRNTGMGLDGSHLTGSQTGDAPGGIQTGSGSFGTGRDVAQDDRKMTDKVKDAVTGNKDHAHDHTVGKGASVEGGITGGHPGAGITGGSDSTTYGSNTAARDFDQRTGSAGNMGVGNYQGSNEHGVVSGGAAGTDRFDAPRRDNEHITHTDRLTGTGADHGHTVGNKGSDDHKLSGVTRHGDDFTKGDTADSAYKNYDATGLTGRENTTTGVHDNNLEGTGAHKEGLMDKVKNLIGGHTNTTHADHK